MAISSINSLTKLRLNGLSSGFDTDAIIRSMMQIEQLKINRQYRARTTLQWKQEALGGVSGDLKSFFNDFISTIGSKSLMTDSAFNAYKAEVTGKYASAVTVSTTAYASPGKVTINAIDRLAKATEVKSGNTSVARVSSSASILAEGAEGLNGSTTLGDLALKLKTNLQFVDGTDEENNPAEVIKFKINGNELTFTKNTTVDQMVQGIRRGTNWEVDAFFNWNTGKLQLEAETSGRAFTLENVAGNAFGGSSAFGIPESRTGFLPSSNGISLGGYGLGNVNQTQLKDLNLAKGLEFDNHQISFKLNGQTFTFKDTDTLGKMMSTINGSDAGVQMSYSELSDGFTIKTANTGAATSISIQNLKGNAFGNDSAFGLGTATYRNGQDAQVRINGIIYGSDKNNFTIDGINYTLNKQMQDLNEPIEITVSRDVTEPMAKIKEFVDGYNTMIKKLEGLLKERKSTDEAKYIPLTDDEKAEMTDKQIEQWEAIAKKGILRNDAGIQNLVNRLRGALFDSVSSVGLSPSAIGLSTGNYFLGNGGQINLDETKLRQALESDPQAVMSMFKSYDDTLNPTYEGSGLLTRINLIFDDYNKGPGEVTLAGIEYSLKQVTDKVTSLQKKMLEKEEKLYKQFAAMETALAKIQSQSDWLSGMLGSASGK